VTVRYLSDVLMTQIELDENYPNATQENVSIAVLNCDGKYSSLLSDISVFYKTMPDSSTYTQISAATES